MIGPEAAPLLLDIARSVVSLVRTIDPGWRAAYLRVVIGESVAETKMSYAHPAGVEIVDVLRHKTAFHAFAPMGEALLAALGKERGLFLLAIRPDLEYEIEFEYRDMSRWRISKLNGGNGLPEGFPA
jgi:hypothetical protein